MVGRGLRQTGREVSEKPDEVLLRCKCTYVKFSVLMHQMSVELPEEPDTVPDTRDTQTSKVWPGCRSAGSPVGKAGL